MAYNKASEERKWRLWKETEEKQLRELGVSEEKIAQLRAYDWEMFNSDRRYYEHHAEGVDYLEQLAVSEEEPDAKTVSDFLSGIDSPVLFRLLSETDPITRSAGATSIRSEKKWRQADARMRPGWKPAGSTEKIIRRFSGAESSGAGVVAPISDTAAMVRKRKAGTAAGISSTVDAILQSAFQRKSSHRLSGMQFKYSLLCLQILSKLPGG